MASDPLRDRLRERVEQTRAVASDALRADEWIRGEDMLDDLREAGYLVVTVGSLVEAAQRHAELESRLRAATGAMHDALGLLTPGMKAGVGEARKLLQDGLSDSRPSGDGLSGHNEPRGEALLTQPEKSATPEREAKP